MAKAYEDLTFTDDFMFCKVLTMDLELCRDILELILDIKIREVRISESQKSVEITPDGRGVRFDVYVEDEKNTVFDLEMQASPNTELPKRSRYYQGMIDLNLLERGAYFAELKRSFVIFICLKDYFDADLPIYTFENLCLEDTSIRLNDEAVKVFINADCKRQGLPPHLKELFEYLQTQKPTGILTQRIDNNVHIVTSNKKWRQEYMTLEMKLHEEREEGRIEGRNEGAILELKRIVEDGILTLDEAATRVGMTAEDFLKEFERIRKDDKKS